MSATGTFQRVPSPASTIRGCGAYAPSAAAPKDRGPQRNRRCRSRDRWVVAADAVRSLADRTRLGCSPGWQLRAAVGKPGRWQSAGQLYRSSGLSPMQYESAGDRRNGRISCISREGSVQLRCARSIASGHGAAIRPLAATPSSCVAAGSGAGSSAAPWVAANRACQVFCVRQVVLVIGRG